MDVWIRDAKLRAHYGSGGTGWHQPAVVKRFALLMSVLDAAQTFDDVRALRQFDAHPLLGKRSGQWALKLSGNYRAVVELREDENGTYIEIVEVVDYH